MKCSEDVFGSRPKIHCVMTRCIERIVPPTLVKRKLNKGLDSSLGVSLGMIRRGKEIVRLHWKTAQTLLGVFEPGGISSSALLRSSLETLEHDGLSQRDDPRKESGLSGTFLPYAFGVIDRDDRRCSGI